MKFRVEFADRTCLVLDDDFVTSVEMAIEKLRQLARDGCIAFTLADGTSLFVYRHQVKHIQFSRPGDGFLIYSEKAW